MEKLTGVSTDEVMRGKNGPSVAGISSVNRPTFRPSIVRLKFDVCVRMSSVRKWFVCPWYVVRQSSDSNSKKRVRVSSVRKKGGQKVPLLAFSDVKKGTCTWKKVDTLYYRLESITAETLGLQHHQVLPVWSPSNVPSYQDTVDQE